MDLFFIILSPILLALFYFFWYKNRHRKLLENLKLKLFLIRLPHSSREGKDFKSEINISEQLFSSLAAFKKPFVFEIAVPYISEEIHFYVSVPENLGDPLIRQILSLWNDASVLPVEDYNIFNYSGVATGGLISQKERFAIPIRTYNELNADTFLPILGGLSKINEVGEGGAVQFIVRPAPLKAKKEIRGIIRMLKKGAKLKDVLAHPLAVSLSDITEAISPPKKTEKNSEKIIDETAIKALEAKLAKPLFELNVRLVASAPSQYQADSIFEGLSAGFSQFGAPDRNELKTTKLKNNSNFFYQFSFREFDPDHKMTLNSEELASLLHLPTSFTEIPKIRFVKAKEASPPSNLVSEGVLIGESFYRGQAKEVRISDDDRRRHVYIVGQTGTGKSNLLTNMAISDIERGKGVAIVDPHGDFIDSILALVPKERFKDVIVFDPSDLARPLGLNMIEHDINRPEEKTFIVNEMQSIFNKLFLAETMGPMFEQYMRNALLLLMEDEANEPATLMEVPRVFTDVEFRRRKLDRIQNPAVIDFWEKEAVKAGGEASLANMTPYITSKFNNFTANDYIRVIIGQPKSALNFRKIMDEGKILLINLSKGKIGDINANLLGMIIVGKLLMAALGRVDVTQEKRRDFNLYIDEFQNFTTDSISTILSEARKYRLNLTIAHQFIAQLTEKIRDSVFGNVGSTIAFRVGAQDADFLVKQFGPVFNLGDLINIDNFNAYVKLLIKGETAAPFNIKTFRARPGDLSVAKNLKEISREKYGMNREEIEIEIHKRLKN